MPAKSIAPARPKQYALFDAKKSKTETAKRRVGRGRLVVKRSAGAGMGGDRGEM